MALVLNEEQQMIRDSAQGFLAENAPVSALRQLRDSKEPKAYSPELWRQMVDLGWAGMVIDEQYGGLGYGYLGLGLVLEECGRNLSVSPLNASVLLGASLVQLAGNDEQKNSLLPQVASGELLLTLALEESAHHAPQKTAMAAQKNADGFLLAGDKQFVLDAGIADKFIVAARTAGQAGDSQGLSLFIVDAQTPGLTVQQQTFADSRNAGIVRFNDVQLSAAALLGTQDEAWSALNTTLDIANIGLSAELLGLSQQAFEMTVAYLKEREQFGVPIGSFQGLQHRAAHLFCELELARTLVLNGLQSIDGDREGLSVLASATKVKLCKVATLATNEGVQMHGGIGMTDEFDMGFYIKRARVLQQSFGGENYHLDRYASLLGY